MLNLTKEVRQRIKFELYENEVIVWAEQSSPNKYTKLIAKIFVYISLPIFIVIFIIMLDSPIFAILLSVIIHACILSFFEYKKAIYMITNSRAIVLYYSKDEKIVSYYPDQLITIKTKKKFGARGDIIFFTKNYKADLEGKQETGNNFINIKDVNRVEALLERLENSANR